MREKHREPAASVAKRKRLHNDYNYSHLFTRAHARIAKLGGAGRVFSLEVKKWTVSFSSCFGARWNSYVSVDLHLEIESISSCGADQDRDPQPLVSSRTSSQDNSTSGDGSRTPTVTAGGCNQRVAETARARSNSARSGRTADASGRRTRVEQRENLSPQTGIGGRETVETLSVPVSTETSTQIARDSERRRTSGPTGSQTLNQTNASPLIEEPPPLYSSLFPAASATNNRQPQCQHQSPYHRPSHTIQHHPFAQRCSVCHPTPHHPFSPHDSNNFCPHNSTFYSHQHHHLGPALPGAIGQHYPEHQSPMREQAVRDICILLDVSSFSKITMCIKVRSGYTQF